MKVFIQKNYPEAKAGSEFTAECVKLLKEDHGFILEKTILATSVCSDEIIRSATNFRDYVKNSNPFILGGLAGYPFSGLTGFRAFASHIPDGGAAIIIYGPHIGILKDGTVGVIQRIGQNSPTHCCGALKASVESLSRHTIPDPDFNLDYQMSVLQRELKEHQEEVLQHSVPLVQATEKMYEIIHERIYRLVNSTKSSFSGFRIALIGGIIINTDYDLPDWFEPRNFDIVK